MLITEACVRSGAEVFVGYPITPSNWFYSYSQQRFPLFFAGPDEISVLQWMAGFSASGKFPITATAFPGLALMMETLNMVYMMELPMVLVLVQRMGPSTGSATTGAQGDLGLLNGAISGGLPLPVFCPSDFEDSWNIANECVKTAVKFRTPVILLTSKEMVMTKKSFDIAGLPEIEVVDMDFGTIEEPYKPYKAGADMVPPLVPLGNDKHQVRITASTHDEEGTIKKATPGALANTQRLKDKLVKRIDEFTFYDLDADEGAEKLIVTYGISADAARDAVIALRKKGEKVAFLVMKTILPVPPKVLDIIDSYQKVLFVEENISGTLQQIIFGNMPKNNVKGVNKFGSMINPSEIVAGFDSF